MSKKKKKEASPAGAVLNEDVRIFHNNERKISFLEIPKTGCTSIFSVLEATEISSEKKEGFFLFTLFRDVPARIRSGYYELLRQRAFQGSFSAFLEKIQKEGFFNRHIRPISYYIKGAEEAAVFFIEDPGTEEALSEALGKEIKIPVLNNTKIEKIKLTEDHLSLIEEIYKEDFQLLNLYK